MLKKLEYTMKLANRKIEELEDMDDKIQTNLSDLFRKHFQEIIPQSRTMENIAPESINLNSKLHENKASVACTTASETKDTPQEKNTISEDHYHFSTDSEFGETDGNYDNDPNEQHDVSREIKEAKIKLL